MCLIEIWDLYNVNGQMLNRTCTNIDPLCSGEYHLYADIWTINYKNELLLTLRSPQKDTHPNKWENTGGSVLSGESSQQGALRELYEETGITATESELIKLGEMIGESTIYHIYILRKDVSESDVILNPDETVDAKWVTIEMLYDMIDEELLVPAIKKKLGVVLEKIKQLQFKTDWWTEE